MALNSTHPSYDAHVEEWELMRTAYAGEGAVKRAGVKYLPATPGQVLDGALKPGAKADNPGLAAYNAYKMRAKFPDYVSEAVERFIGMLHNKPATIELPDGMADMLDKATIDGESLQNLLRRINEQQLVIGRLGLMLDLPSNPDQANPMPYIALYYGESARNWDNSDDHVGVNALTLVVLDESGPVRDSEFTWTERERYRVLQLGAVLPVVTTGTDSAQDQPQEGNTTKPDDSTEGVGPRVYLQGVFEISAGAGLDPSAMMAPVLRGMTLEQIPFVFINHSDILPSPDDPPLLGLGNLCMTIYRGEADYRHTLFMQGQDTLVTMGTIQQEGQNVDSDMPLRVGAGAHISLDLNGDAKYIGIGAEGIAGQQQALDDDKKEAEAKAGTIIAPTAGKQESGDAMSTRLAAQTSSLVQIAKAGAAGLENILKIAATWLRQDPEKVKVTPNLEFGKLMITGQEVTQLMAARTLGAPISLESIHSVMQDRGLAKFDYEAELDKIAEEDMDRAKRVATLPQPPAPPAPAPAPGAPTPKPAPKPAA